MSYFVIQVQTRKEEEFLLFTKKKLADTNLTFFLPRRKLRIRRNGKWVESISPIFPGYIFLKSNYVHYDLYKAIKCIPGFIRFLVNNYNITPLNTLDEEIINHFISYGEIVGKSYVCYDANRKVKVISGPLKGLEGNIIKINKRKKRIKVKLTFYKNSYPIDFSFEVIKTIGNETGNSEEV